MADEPREGGYMTTGKKSRFNFGWILMGFVILGLGGFGITEFATTGASSIGSVGEARITAADYQRALRQQINEASMQMGRYVTMDEARAFGINIAAQQQLVASATLEEEARVLGISVGDEIISKQILAAPSFQGLGGQFDRNAYRDALSNLGMTEVQFEHGLRMGEAAQIIYASVSGGIEAPQPLLDRWTSWQLQSRDIEWVEVTADDLPEPVTLPEEATLKMWHEANSAKFTAPEIRHITYGVLTPEMLLDEVLVDEQALRDLYEEAIESYQLPERRIVGQLVFPNFEAAQAAKDSVDAGASFEEIAAQRGLSLADTDLGEVTKARLGKAGEAVFAATDNGVVGPVDTDIGPALFSVNAILEPVDVSFEDAKEDLRAEAAADQARRTIEKEAEASIDLIAGGASIEDLANTTGMDVGSIDWRAGDIAEPGHVAAYPVFREQAALIAEGAFLELHELEDGGILVLRLDNVTPPSVIPFDEAREAVEQDWLETETHRRLLSWAEARREAAMAGKGGVAEVVQDTEDADGEAQTGVTTKPTVNRIEGLMRDGFVENAPLELVLKAFAMEAAGETEIVDAEGRVILVTLREIHNADLKGEDAAATRQNVANRLSQSLSLDVMDHYLKAAMAAHGLKLDAAAISQIEAVTQ